MFNKKIWCLIIIPLSQLFMIFQASASGEQHQYKCDIRISSSDTPTVIKKGGATVFDMTSSFFVDMPNGDRIFSPDLVDTADGLNKQKGTIGQVTFIRRLDFDDKFIIENYNTGFFYKMRNCEVIK